MLEIALWEQLGDAGPRVGGQHAAKGDEGKQRASPAFLHHTWIYGGSTFLALESHPGPVHSE